MLLKFVVHTPKHLTPMTFFRELIAVAVFWLGAAIAATILSAMFNWLAFFGACLCFVLAYFIWPSHKKGQRPKSHFILDAIEFIIEMPVEFLLWILKLLGRLLHNINPGL